MSMASFGVRKPVAANLVMFAIIGAGVIFGFSLRREFFPEVRPNEVIVSAPYPGAPPDEIEETLARKIEDRVFDLSDVEEINTTITEGGATVRIEFVEGISIDYAVDEVKREIDALEDLPENSDRIRVEKLEPNLPAISMSLISDRDERDMKRLIRQMRDDLRTLPSMGAVAVSGTRGDEISVEVSPAAMLEHRISLPDIAARVRAGMAELPAGPVRLPTSHVSVRTMGAQERAAAVREIIIKAGSDGHVLRLGDIAQVRDSFADVDFFERVNGQPCVSLTAYVVGDEDVIEVSDMVKAYFAGRIRQDGGHAGRQSPVQMAYELGLSRPAVDPDNVVLHTDLARFIRQRLNLLQRNALWGGVLVFLTLVILLNWRVALWVGLGLVISILGTLAVMHLLDITLNLLTMFGLIVVIGLLVDDAIIVAENIVTRHETGEPALTAAVKGTQQVAWPVVTTVLTTICAFLPLALIQGRMGDMLEALPVVVACALLVSLVESLLILPSHLGHSLVKIDIAKARRRESGKARKRESSFIERARDKVFHGWIADGYRRLLGSCLHYRYLTFAIAIAALLASLSLPLGGKLKVVFFDSSDSETVMVDLTMPIGTPLSVTDHAVSRIEAIAGSTPEVVTVSGLVGIAGSADGSSVTSQTNIGQVWLELLPAEQRERTSTVVMSEMRQRLGTLTGIKNLRFSGIQGGPTGLPIMFTVSSEQPSQLAPVVAKIKDLLRTYEGVFDIGDDSDSGQRELRITLRDGAHELGFTTADIASQIRAAIFGIEAHTFADNQEDVDVRVMADKATRRSLSSIEHMHVFTPTGDPVPLSEVAVLEEGETYATIRRLDRRRAITISADVDAALDVSADEVLLDLAPHIEELRHRHPAVRITPRGREEEMQESFSTLPIGMLTAAGLIYVILAWLFSSYTQPILVMLAVPFAAIGMIWGHIVLGFNMTFLSLVGFVALSGIVVNVSLIFMEFYNMKRRTGVSPKLAAQATGQARLRPILMTTITTVLGLSPLMLEQSFQARFLIPMAITISFGLISATVLTLLLLPCLLVMAHDLRRVLRLLWTGRLDTHHQSGSS